MERRLSIPDTLETNIALLDEDRFNSWFDNEVIPNKSIPDKAADFYDKLPSYMKSLKNFDFITLGFAGYCADILVENKALRNEKRFKKILFYYFLAIRELQLKVNNIEMNKDRVVKQLPPLSEVYLDHSMRAYQLEKIEYFKNALVNGVMDCDREFDEKINIFNIITSLTIGEIKIVVYIYDKSIQEIKLIKIDEISVAFPLSEKSHLEQLCDNLVGKGLLIRVRSSGLGSAGVPIGYHKAGYIDRFVEYIKDTNTII